MNSPKRRILLIFGGRSAEHEISIHSARSVAAALNPSKFEILPLYVDRHGRWENPSVSNTVLMPHNSTGNGRGSLEQTQHGNSNSMVLSSTSSPAILNMLDGIDVVLPLVHGPYGEDGTLQGTLELAGIPYVGSGVLGSAMGMDKHIAKMVLRTAGIPVVDWLLIEQHEWEADRCQWENTCLGQIGFPCFVKPVNLGSSVGVHKVQKLAALSDALNDAFRYDLRVIIEPAINPLREVECAVLGLHAIDVSVCGEVTTRREFYDYTAKYADDETTLTIPANLPPEVSERIRDLSRRTFRALSLAGMARVDFFVSNTNVYVNEVNTIPGFTEKSMYPKLWEASGVPYAMLLERLIDLAIERYKERRRLAAH